MKWRRSLSLRVVGYLLAAQVFAFLIGWVIANALGLYGVEGYEMSTDDFALARARDLVVESLVRNKDGSVGIVPSPALQAEIERTPRFKFAAFDPSGWQAVPGSSSDLASALEGIGNIKPSFSLFSIGESGLLSNGSLQVRNTPYGRLHIAIQGQKFQWKDIWFSLWNDFKSLSVYLFPLIIFSIGVAWFAVRRGLAPLHAVANEAARIDMNSLNQRLSDATAPIEIQPLVDSMNDALARLDGDAARLRRFAANAAHELRTPVAILTARLDAPPKSTFINDLQRDAHRIRNIVEQLLATVRLSERPADVMQEIDLVAIGKSKAADVMLIAIQDGRHVEFEGPSTPIIIRGSRLAIESIISNLIENALRAEPKGGTVHLRIGPDATIDVIDHGEGVAENDRDLIFEPFWRKSDATAGAGLGLAIVKELTKKLGGRIWVEETPGGGATFKLSFVATNSN